MSKQRTDVLIVGAGPAGSLAAYYLARHGHAVSVVDRHAFPRDKACGDALIPDALACLARAGLLARVTSLALPLGEVALYSPARVEVVLRGQFLTIERFKLDHLLLSAALDAGAVFHKRQVTRIQVADSGILANTANGERIEAELALIAAGADLTLPKQLGSVYDDRPTGVAARMYIQSDYKLDRLVISYDASIVPGYGWIFPLPNGAYNIGAGVELSGKIKPNEALHRFLEAFPIARAICTRASSRGRIRGARIRCGLRGVDPVIQGRILVIGETLGTTFHFTGEGIGKAMETAELAATVAHEALQTGDWARLRGYETLLETLAPRYKAYEVAHRWVGVRWVTNWIFRRIAAEERLRQRLEAIVDETADPTRVFSLRGLLRALAA